MSETEPPQHPSEESLKTYLITELGVHADVTIVHHSACLTATAFGLSEKDAGLGFVLGGAADEQYDLFSRIGALPPRLQSKEAFLERYKALAGLTHEDLRESEIALTVARNRHLPPPAIQRPFEEGVARFFSHVVSMYTETNPEFLPLAQRASSFLLQYVDGVGNCLVGNPSGLQGRLPSHHSGVLHCAPALNDSIARLGEAARPRGWQNVALLNSNPFNAAFNRAFATDAFGLTPKRLIATGEGLADGVMALVEERRGNKRLQAGFGAMILTAVSHLPWEQLSSAIQHAPGLLARGGVLAISELESPESGEGGIWRLIAEARDVLGTGYEDIAAVTSHGGSEGRQAIFKNTRQTQH